MEACNSFEVLGGMGGLVHRCWVGVHMVVGFGGVFGRGGMILVSMCDSRLAWGIESDFGMIGGVENSRLK